MWPVIHKTFRWRRPMREPKNQPLRRRGNKVLCARADFEWHFNLNPLPTCPHISSRKVSMTTGSPPGPDIWSQLLIFADQSVWGQGMSDTHNMENAVMDLLLPSLPPSPLSNLPVTHSLSLPRSQPLITVIGGFGEIRQRDRKEGKKQGCETGREVVGGQRLRPFPLSFCSVFVFSHHLSLYPPFFEIKSHAIALAFL